MSKDVFITGTSGVLGFETLSAFYSCGTWNVCGVSRSDLPVRPSALPNRQVDDVFNPQWFDTDAADATIIHFAGLSDPRANYDSYVDMTIRDVVPHVEMTEDLVARGWCGHMIFISSGGAVYGDIDSLPISEQEVPRPKGFYALQKLTVENALTFLANQHGFRLTILRVSNPFGSLLPKKGQGVIPILLDAALNGTPFTLFGSGEQLRDYLHMSDFLAALECACTADLVAPVNTINIGSGAGTSLNTLIELVTKLTGSTIDVIRSPARFDVKSNVLDIRKAQDLLGWRPAVGVQDGIRLMLEEQSGPKLYRRATGDFA